VARLASREEDDLRADKCDIRLVSKVGDDSIGQSILEELRGEGIDCSSVKVGTESSTSAFTYIIVDSKTQTRTCIHTPLQQPMVETEVINDIDDLLEGARLVYFDGRHTDVALHVARAAKEKKIPILVDAEKPRPYLNDLLKSADIVITSENFYSSQDDHSMLDSVLRLAEKTLVSAKLVIVTRGGSGSIAFANPNGGLVKDISHSIGPEVERQIQDSDGLEDYSNSNNKKLVEDDLGGPYEGIMKPVVREVDESVLISSSALIPNVVDTTGAGDAYIGALVYGFLHGQDTGIANIITFASVVAGLKCQRVGARSGLPYGKDLPFLNEFLLP
jgi:sugar/nucleoside kinase (ribokinase family)